LFLAEQFEDFHAFVNLLKQPFVLGILACRQEFVGSCGGGLKE
jgi:hypothetical protein